MRFRSIISAVAPASLRPLLLSAPSLVFLVLSCLALAVNSHAHAQQGQTPASRLNLPHLDNQQGPTIGALSQSGRESVNIGSGQLSAFLPVLDLPQHGGRVLHLGYVYSGNPWSTKETSTTYNQYGTANGSNPQTWWLESYATLQWLQNQTGPFFGPLHLNLPTLTADLMYMGMYQVNSAIPTFGGTYCLTDWTFSDWQGATHTFNGFRDCTNWNGSFTKNYWMITREATDGSGYQIDLTSATDPKVVGPDGVVYHFPTYTPPANNGGSNSQTNGYVQLSFYSRVFATIVDPNSNTISYSPDTRTLTDTNGVKIGVDLSGSLTWQVQDSPTATLHTVSTSLTQTNSGQTVPFDSNSVPSCTPVSPGSYMGGPQAAGYTGPAVTAPVAPTVYSSYATMLNLPDGSTYEVDSDSLSRLTKIRYPSGGYTRYDYQTLSSTSVDEGDMRCVRPTTVVIAKHECSSSSGSCVQSPAATQSNCAAGFPSGGEATTCYFQNGSNVVNPKLETVAYTFTSGPAGSSASSSGVPGWVPHYFPPLETSHTVFAANSTVPLEKLDTSYVTPINCPNLGEWCDAVAGTIKTTFYSSAGSATGVAEHDVTVQYPDNLLTSKDFDFSGSTIRSITNVYETGGIYAATGATGSLYHLLDRVHSTKSLDGIKGLQKNETDTHDALGNLVQADVAGTGIGTASTKVQLNSQGDVTQFWDPMQFAGTHTGSTTMGYGIQGIGNCPQNAGPALPTSVTNALSQTTLYAYYGFGKLACIKDPNGQITMYSYDSLGRLSEVDSADGGQTTARYTSVAPLTMTVNTVQNASQTQSRQTVVDGFGRTSQTILTSPEGQICSETFYDALGNVSAVNDPHLGCTTTPSPGGSIAYTYDALGRRLIRTNEDNTTTQWTYSGPTVTTQDEAGHLKQQATDALGRLIQVVEPNAQNSLSLSTSYTYDGFGDLWNATQSGVSGETARTRSFTYNGLSQLITANNPETGITCYGNLSSGSCANGYDANGNLLYRTDATGMTVTRAYDTLNRVTAISAPDYADTFLYMIYDRGTNGIGRLYEAGNSYNGSPLYDGIVKGAGGTRFTYDKVGRVAGTTRFSYALDKWQPGMGLTYDLAGNITGLQYPDGRAITEVWDPAGRLTTISDMASGVNYFGGSAADTKYWPSGSLMSTKFGNAVTQSFVLNNRLQLCHAMASTTSLPANSSGGNLLDRQLFHNHSAASPCGNESGNNGNIFVDMDNRQIGRTQGFDYDPLDRLTSASRSDGAYNYTYTYDSFGNMMVTDNLHSNLNYSIDPTNRLLLNSTDMQYDAAGKVISTPNPLGGSHALRYTGQGLLRDLDNYQKGSYLYNGLNERVFATHDNLGWTDYTYLNGEPIAELTSNGVWSDYIYAAGRKIVRIDSAKPILHLRGTRANNFSCGAGGAVSGVSSALQGYTIQAGDRLVLSMKQNLFTDGGLALIFTTADASGDNGTGSLKDTSSGQQLINNPNTDGLWHSFVGDLTPYKGRVVSYALAAIHADAANGTFDLQMADAAIVNASGTDVQILNGAQSVPNFGGAACSGSNMSASTESTALSVTDTLASTRYYLDDQIGTVQMEIGAGGWPLWQGAYTPFGQEIVNGVTQLAIGTMPADGTAMNYKFTGKERDVESGLDYFGARFYGSNMGRFLSPDWSAHPEAVPYASLSDPQSLNLYSYVGNNPLRRTDPDGHLGLSGGTPTTCNGSSECQTDGEKLAAYKRAQQQNANAPAAEPTPNPNGSVPPPPPGKGPGWKPGDPLTPNEWVPGPGSDDRPVRWNPKYPIPGQSPPNTSWDGPNGHWDNPDGKGNTNRWLPGGGRVDHDNNPVARGVASGAAAIGTGYIIYRIIRFLPSLAPPLWPTIPANAVIP